MVRSVCLFCLVFCILSVSSVLLAGEDDADDKSAGSAGTEYDDIEEQAHNVSHPQTPAEDDPVLPLLPKRPENLLGTALKFPLPPSLCVCLVWAHVGMSVTFACVSADEVTYEVEAEGEQDYDDAMPGENAEIPLTDPSAQADVNMDAETDAVVEVDVHAQPE